MSKFKLEHGVKQGPSRPAQDHYRGKHIEEIDLICQWSNNERNYIINELLRFALTQEEDFLKYRASLSENHPGLVAISRRIRHRSKLRQKRHGNLSPQPTNAAAHA